MSSKFPYWRQCLLIGSAVLFWAMGTYAYYAIYSAYPTLCGSDIVSTAHNGLEIFVRSIWSALTLFAFSIDSNAIDGWLDASGNAPHWPAWLLSFAALGAGAWTINFAMQLLWNSCKSWYKRYQNSNEHHDTLYIFWGINQRSIRLANELSKEDANGYCLFVVNPAIEEKTDKGVDRLLSRSKRRSELQKQFSTIPGSILIAEQNLCDVEIDQDCWKKMGVRLLERYIQNSDRIHVLLLGEDENANIYDALRMDNVLLWGNSTKFENAVTIHCVARRGNANRIMEDVTSHRVIEIVDSSHLAIDMLKRDVENHPVNFVDVKEGLVSSAFRTLIIGFSECGQDALRFLYEFGAFVDAKSKTEAKDEKHLDIFRSPFYCDVVDKQFDPSAARWIHHAPELFKSLNHDETKERIKMHRMNYNSRIFYSGVLDKIIQELNYVVIAVGDDKAGITLAIDILRFAIKEKRVDLTKGKENKFRIYVRSYNPAMLDYLRKIEEHYTVDKVKFIQIFGEEEALYTKKMLIEDEFTELSKTYQEHYENCRVANKIDAYPAEYWDARRKEAFKPEGEKLLKNLLNLQRQESQDRANALHALTKFAIRGSFTNPEDEQLKTKMGWLEHIRWEAAHEVMGYRYGEKDILRYRHDCMLPWQKLQPTSRSYDLTVWDTTLKLEEEYRQRGYLK